MTQKRKISINDGKSWIDGIEASLSIDATGEIDPQGEKETYTGTGSLVLKGGPVSMNCDLCGDVTIDVNIKEFEYNTSGNMPFIFQGNFLTNCWAACAAMMKTYKDKDPADNPCSLDDIWNIFPEEKGNTIDCDEMQELAKRMGLAGENEFQITPRMILRLLYLYGPLWMQQLHGIILMGIKGDGTVDNTVVFYMDPVLNYQKDTFSGFLQKFSYFPNDETKNDHWVGPRLFHWGVPQGTQNPIYIKAEGEAKVGLSGSVECKADDALLSGSVSASNDKGGVCTGDWVMTSPDGQAAGSFSVNKDVEWNEMISTPDGTATAQYSNGNWSVTLPDGSVRSGSVPAPPLTNSSIDINLEHLSDSNKVTATLPKPTGLAFEGTVTMAE